MTETQALRRTLRLVLSVQFRRFRSQAADMLTVSACAALLGGLLYYIGKDFLGGGEGSAADRIGEDVVRTLRLLCGGIAMPFGAALLAGFVRSELGATASLPNLAWFGVPRPLLAFAQRLLRCLTLGMALVAAGALALAFLTGIPSGIDRILVLGFTACSLILTLGLGKALKSVMKRFSAPPDVSARALGPVRWRLMRLLGRPEDSTAAWLLGVIGYGLLGAGLYRGAGFAFAAIAGLVAGLGWAFLMSLDSAQSVRWTWIERTSGVSHRSFVAFYGRLAVVFGSLHACIMAAAMVSAALAVPPSEAFVTISELARVLGISICPIALYPALMFQIDVRRPVVQLMAVLLTSLLIGTAMLAHVLLVALLPLAYYYAARYQDKRYYRVE